MSNSNKNVARAAIIVMVAMVVSRILGYLRDVFIYATFGQNRITDAYQAAFSVPDCLYMLLVGGALSASFIPVFSSYIAKGQEDEAWETASILFNVVSVCLIIGLVISYIFTPQLVNILVPGFDGESLALTITLTRVMLLQVVFMSMAGLTAGVLQSFKLFAPTAIGSVLYNLGIIVVGVLFSGIVEKAWPGHGIAAFSIGVVIGAFSNFIIQFHWLRKVGIKYHFSFDLKHEGFRKLIGLMIPVFIGLSFNQLNLFVNQNLASGLSDGLLAALRTGQRFQQLPIAVFAISIAIAMFPTLTSYAAKNEAAKFKKSFSLGFRSVIFITIPCAVLLAVLAVPYLRFMFEYASGAFTHESTVATAYGLQWYCLGIFAYGTIHILSRSFYAYQDTKTPVIMGAVGMVINIIFSILLVGPMAQGGLALAYSMAGIVNMVLLMISLRRRIGAIDGRNIVASFVKTILASAIMGVVAFMSSSFIESIVNISTKSGQLIQILVATLLAGAVFVIIGKLLRMEEADMVFNMIMRKFKRKQRA